MGEMRVELRPVFSVEEEIKFHSFPTCFRLDPPSGIRWLIATSTRDQPGGLVGPLVHRSSHWGEQNSALQLAPHSAHLFDSDTALAFFLFEQDQLGQRAAGL